MRLFASLALDEAAATHLDLAIGAVNPRGGAAQGSGGRPALRWTPAGQRHITLAYYGEVPDGAVDDLAGDLADSLAAHHPMRLRLRGSGVFSGRTLWAGVQADARRDHSRSVSELTRLMAACEDAGAQYARAAVAERDRRRAHVTLARARDKRTGEPELRRRAAALSIYEGPAWTASSALLVRSELGEGPSGTALHTPVVELPLGTGYISEE